MGKISKSFDLKEFLVSDKRPDLVPKIITELPLLSLSKILFDAGSDEISFNAHEEAILRLSMLCANCLQPLRDKVGSPAKILSGYRSPMLNSAIGGEEDSDHMYALAADITFPGREEEIFSFYKWGVKNLAYRQIIYYPTDKFIHLSTNWPGREFKHSAWVKVGKDFVPLEEFSS